MLIPIFELFYGQKNITNIKVLPYSGSIPMDRNVDSDGYLHSSDFRTERNPDGSIDLDIRYLGKWKNPSYARHEEDYDWQELTPKSKKQISKVIKTIQKQTKRKISCDGSEKNWLSFHIE